MLRTRTILSCSMQKREDMTARFAMLRSLLSPAQLEQFGRVRDALDKDPTCLDRKGDKHEERIQGLPAVEVGGSEGSRELD